jgi:chromosome segregation ATPase
MEIMALQTSMKDYSQLKKKLENRRLDYDAKLNKLNKSKKEKPGLGEEMNTAQAKYNETLADVEALMSTFAEREVPIHQSLNLFLLGAASGTFD